MAISRKRQRIVAVAGAVVAAGAVLAVPSAAFAAFDDAHCNIWDSLVSCHTRTIEAHSSQHWVRFKVVQGDIFSIMDTDTHADVTPPGSRVGDFRWHTINGLSDHSRLSRSMRQRVPMLAGPDGFLRWWVGLGGSP
jgi:hypothetical protein